MMMMMVISRHEPVKGVDEQLVNVIHSTFPFESGHHVCNTVAVSSTVSVTMLVFRHEAVKGFHERLTGVIHSTLAFESGHVCDTVDVSSTVSVLVTTAVVVATKDGRDGMLRERVPNLADRTQGRRVHDDLLVLNHTLAIHKYWPSKRCINRSSLILPLL